MADNTVALQVQTPNTMQTLGSILNVASGIQNLQQQKQQIGLTNIELQKKTQANQERLRLQSYFSDPNNWQTDGQIDMGKVNKAVPEIAPLTGADYIGKLTALSNAQTQANQAKLNFTQGERNIVAGLYGVLGRAGVDDPTVVDTELDRLKTQYPNNPEIARYVDAAKVGLSTIPGGKGLLPKALITQSQSLISPEGQQGSLTPTAGLTNTGGALSETIVKPSVAGNEPSVSMTGRSQTLTLPPTATEFNPNTNAPQYVGKSPTGGTVQSGPALGQPEAYSGAAGSATTDWRSVQESAKTAAQDVGVLQEIKKYAPGAVTGVESDRRSYLSGLAGLIGMSPEQMSKTDTDLLAKNSNMLALAGGDTNLAKTLAESANPNVHMTPQAIMKAANQVIAQRQLALARQKYLQPYITDPIAYSHAVTMFNQYADPRVLQLPNMSKEDAIHMKAAMSPEERKQFGDKIRWMQQQGFLH